MWPNPQERADLVTFTAEIFNGKLHFLCSVRKRLLAGVLQKKLLLKTFTKFKGKYLCCSLFLTKLRLFSLQLYQRPWRSCCVCSVCNFLKDSDTVVAFVQSTTLSKTLTQLLRLFSLQLYQRLWHSCCVCSVCNFIKDSDAGVFFWILWYFWQRLLYRVLLSDCFCPV